MKRQNKNRLSSFPGQISIEATKPGFSFVCNFCVFSILFVLVFLRYFYFLLSIIAWQDRPHNDLLRVERNAKHLLTCSCIFCLLLVNVSEMLGWDKHGYKEQSRVKLDLNKSSK